MDERRDPAITLLPAEVNKVTVDSSEPATSTQIRADMAVQQQGGSEVVLWSLAFSEEVQTTGKVKFNLGPLTHEPR